MSINSYMAAHLEETAAKIKVVCSGLSHVAAEMEDLKAENAELLKALERATFLLNEISRTRPLSAIVAELRAVIAKAYARKRKMADKFDDAETFAPVRVIP
jgi:uncharacterized coiled-coil protein SlyX